MLEAMNLETIFEYANRIFKYYSQTMKPEKNRVSGSGSRTRTRNPNLSNPKNLKPEPETRTRRTRKTWNPKPEPENLKYSSFEFKTWNLKKKILF